MPTVATFLALLDSASSAIQSGDYATARKKALAAQTELAGLPDASKDGAQLSWARGTIADILAEVRREQAATSTTGGIQTSRVKYVRPTSESGT